MAIIPIDKLPEEQVSTAKKSNIIPISELPDDAPKKDLKSTFREGLRQQARNMIGVGLSEFVPGLESDLTKAGSEAGMKLGKTITNSMGVPNTPNYSFTFGDIKGNINPNSVTSTLLGGMLDPRSLAGGISMTGPGQAMERSAIQAARPGALMKGARKAMKEAEHLTTQILQPTTKELSRAISSGRQLPSIKRGAENIISAKTFEDVVNNLKTTTKELFQERDMILNENNVPIGTGAFDELDNLANSALKDKLLSPSKLRAIDNVYAREAEFLADNPTMDVVTAQARKEKLQEVTRPLLEKRAAGNLTGLESAELKAYDALRSGYRKAILKALPKDKANLVDKINSKYEGLLDATELASSQAARGIKEVPKTLIDKVAASFGLSPQFTAFRLATKEVAGLVGKTHLEKTTSKIAELRAKSDTLRQLAHLARKVKS